MGDLNDSAELTNRQGCEIGGLSGGRGKTAARSQITLTPWGFASQLRHSTVQ